MATLEAYRGRFAHYRLDPDLRRAHQLYPWITTWDDHETTNDSWRDGAENHDDGDTPDEDGLDWEERKRRAWKAYREWLPIDVDASSMDEPIVLYRSLAYGDLADLIVMDTRIEGRDEPLFGVGSPDLGSGADDPSRRMISDARHDLVYGALSRVWAAWRIVLQQVMMMQWNAGGVPQGLGGNDVPVLVDLGGGNPVNGDAWDGYPAERAALFAHLRNGDITEDPYDPAVYDPTAQPAHPPQPRRGVRVHLGHERQLRRDRDGGRGHPRGRHRRVPCHRGRDDGRQPPHQERRPRVARLRHRGRDRRADDLRHLLHADPRAERRRGAPPVLVRRALRPRLLGHRVVRADAPTTTRDTTPPAPPATASTPPGPPAGAPGPAPAAVPTLPATGGTGQLLTGMALAGVGAVVTRRLRAGAAAADRP